MKDTAKNKTQLFSIGIILLLCFILLFPLFSLNKANESRIIDEKNPKIADVAGSDLYAEKISAYVAGPYSIIRQSLLSNDTNLISHFDINDPAFQDCTVLLSATNSIQSPIFPEILTHDEKKLELTPIKNGFAGFLYYSDEISKEISSHKANRAFDIIQSKFKMDIIKINSTLNNFYPFIGYEPKWEIFLPELIENVPEDGYWDAFDVDRLINKDYYSKNHLSASLLILNSLEFIEKSKNLSLNQLDFNLENYDLSIIDNTELEETFNQLITNLDDFQQEGDNSSIFLDNSDVNQTSAQNELNQFNEILGGLSLSNKSRYSLLSIQYEGRDQGIQKIEENKYLFDLFDALGYSQELKPSEKVYISLTGAFLSELEVNVLCSNIISTNENQFKFSDYLLEQIGLILFLADVEFDIDVLKNYTLEIFWKNNEGLKQNRLDIKNLNDKYDTINLIEILGFKGLPFIPTGLINPINNFKIIYNTSSHEPQIEIRRNLLGGNASYGVFNEFSTTAIAKNIGNAKAWGIPTNLPLNLDDIITQLPGIFSGLAEDLLDSMWDVIEDDYPGQYSSIEDFFNLDEIPRIFYFETLEENSTINYFPDVTNISNLSPYNEDSDEVINKVAIRNPQLIFDLNQLGITNEMLKDFFTNPNSVWNKENWFLLPGETIELPVSNVSIVDFDSFSKFYSYNFTIKNSAPQLPSIISGFTNLATNPVMALEEDNSYWIIDSEQKYIDQHEIEVQFLFENNTKIDFDENTLDKISLKIDFAELPEITDLNFQIYNYSKNIFQDVNSYIETTENNSILISFIKNKNQLGWIFDEENPQNHRIVFKIIGIHDSSFNFSFDNVDIQFLERDINDIKLPQSEFRFSNLKGNVHYSLRSNSILLSTFDMASILVKANMTKNSFKPGERGEYNLYIKNIGSDYALNLSINLQIPGIINKLNNFTLDNNNISINIAKLEPSKEVHYNFSFFIPNSGVIPSPIIKYNNPNNLRGGNLTTLVVDSNDVSYYAPINYESNLPYLKTIAISFTNYSNSELNNIGLSLKNIGLNNVSISQTSIILDNGYGDLKILNNSVMCFQNLSPNEREVQNIAIKKTNWKSYYLPAISNIFGSQSRTIQIYKTNATILGNITLQIIKNISQNEIEVGQTISVSIKVVNSGNLCIKNLQLKDVISFSQEDFFLKEGNLVYNIECLNPGDVIVFTYKIQSKRQVFTELEPAKIKYYYLYENEAESNSLTIKVILPQYIQLMFIVIPCLLALMILGGFIYKFKVYHAKDLEIKRKEISILNLTSEEAVIKIDNTLRDYMKNLRNKKTDIKSQNLNKGGVKK